MLILASKLDPDNEDLRRVIAGISGISVHNYRYPKPGMYDPQVLDSVNEEYRAAGWKRLMDRRDKNSGAGVTRIYGFAWRIMPSVTSRFWLPNRVRSIFLW